MADSNDSTSSGSIVEDTTIHLEDGAIRPFRVEVPKEALVELQARLEATRWPDREIVADQSQGVQLATIQELARYWVTEYD